MRRSVFTLAGRRAVRAAVAQHALLVFDLDGTLAPIVPREERVAMRAATVAHLRRLRTAAPVIVLTGRHVVNAKSILRWEPTLLVGNHGCEGLPETARDLPRIERDCRELIARVAALAARHCPPGSWRIEDKRYTFTFHCASAVQRKAFIELLRRQAKALRCTVIPAKRSCNVLPASAHTKGDAVRLLLRRYGATRAIVVGDDETDETVFALQDRRILGIHVGNRATRAAFFLRRQRSIDSLLALLVREHARLAE